MNKRKFLSSLAATAALASCEKRHADPSATGEPPTLHLYMWADYVKPALVQQFEQENKCRVVIDTFDSNEAMYAKLQAGATGFDIAIPSSYMVKLMQEQDMLSPIDRGMLPNLIFDNQALASHRTMAAILGGILRLPPIQQALASQQVRSRYLVKLLDWGERHFLEN